MMTDLSGKRGLIFGVLNEASLAWPIATKAKEAGASIVLTNTPTARRLGTVEQLAKDLDVPYLPADATDVGALEEMMPEASRLLGGKLDFICHSIGMSPNLRKGRAYHELSHRDFLHTLDISALSLHKILQVADQKDLLSEWASVVAITFMASRETFPFYGDMAEAKAVLESIARSYGYRLGKKLKARVNTVCQGPTPSTAGSGVPAFDALQHYTRLMAPLGNPDAEACAEFILTLFGDATRMVTMQCLYHDGGYHATGMSEEMVALMQEDLEKQLSESKK